MSTPSTHLAQHVNRNLQIVSGAGVLILLLILIDPTFDGYIPQMTVGEMLKFIALLGVPPMLWHQGRLNRPAMCRVIARFTATVLASITFAHTLLDASALMPVLSVLIILVLVHVEWLRRSQTTQEQA